MPLQRVVKQFVKDLVFRPAGVAMGPRSEVRLPRKIPNPGRVRMGADSSIGRFSLLHAFDRYAGISHDGRITIGNNVYIGGFAQLHAMHEMRIGDGTVLSDYVYMSDNAHGLDPRGGLIMRQPLESRGPVSIGRNVFIGYGCVVTHGVTLGDHCIVGANSVVTRSFGPYSMVAGSPARLIKTYDHDSGQWTPVAP